MNKQAECWYNESIETMDTAKVLYKNNKYLEVLFFCHLSLEKMLKAIFVIEHGSTPPKIHNLLLLADRSNLRDELNESQLDFLSKVNSYQLEGRYPLDRELLYQNTSIDNFRNPRDHKKFVDYLSKDIRVRRVILYGSYANGTATEDSDIAIDSPDFSEDYMAECEKLSISVWRSGSDLSLEPLPLHGVMKDFFVEEILTTGKVVYEMDE